MTPATSGSTALPIPVVAAMPRSPGLRSEAMPPAERAGAPQDAWEWGAWDARRLPRIRVEDQDPEEGDEEGEEGGEGLLGLGLQFR